MIKTSGIKTILLAAGFAVVILLVFTHCQNSSSEATAVMTAEDLELRELALAFTSPMPENAFGDRAISHELVELGKMLYYEPRISKSGLISCNTCHSLATFGVDMLPVSLGHGWQTGPINAPTVLNAAFHRTQFWDGRAADVEEQATMPILDALEMAATKEHVLAVLNSIPEYVALFSKAFPQEAEPLNYDNVGVAIGAFERTLVTFSPFDKFLNGDPDALHADQKAGLRLFAETGCQACHRGQALGGNLFAFFQSPAERAASKAHPGRFGFTEKESDKHFFKVPTLLNVARTYPYFHDGSEWDLEKAMKIVGKDMLNKEFTDEEMKQLVAFMESLTGELPLQARTIPILPPSRMNTPRPQFDI
jgi:cytochrome c peroxidase